jgi:hypothetical protein
VADRSGVALISPAGGKPVDYSIDIKFSVQFLAQASPEDEDSRVHIDADVTILPGGTA